MQPEQQPLFPEYISPEEVNALPLAHFEGKIVVITQPQHVAAAVAEITSQPVSGFDTETRPAFTSGESYNVSLVQLAIPDKVFLFRVNLCGLTPELTSLFSSADTLKVGVALRDDIIGLQKLRPFEPAGFREIHDYVKDYGVRNTGLRKLAAILLGVRISKSQQTSNWENPVLTPNQLRYAATDAWVCLEMYRVLKEKGLVDDSD